MTAWFSLPSLNKDIVSLGNNQLRSKWSWSMPDFVGADVNVILVLSLVAFLGADMVFGFLLGEHNKQIVDRISSHRDALVRRGQILQKKYA